tara:strand:- start:207 stop:557 length:351 start_codon:yes stop_codon:yes gene_type:complete
MEKPRERRRRLTLTMLLRAYAMGMFSIVEDRHDLSVFCVDPEIRGFLVHLAVRLRLDGLVPLDVQFVTDHLRHFGLEEIPTASNAGASTRPCPPRRSSNPILRTWSGNCPASWREG